MNWTGNEEAFVACLKLYVAEEEYDKPVDIGFDSAIGNFIIRHQGWSDSKTGPQNVQGAYGLDLFGSGQGQMSGFLDTVINFLLS